MPKTTKPARIALTPRDIQILWSLHEARYLTVELIEWLHFPQWRDRYAQWQQAQAAGSTKRYMPVAQAYHCLRRLEQAQLVRRIVRPAMLAVDYYQREPDLFFLAEQGA